MSVEIERKYLIEYPDIIEIEKISGVKKYVITQTYLCGDDTTERRVRKRESEVGTEYFYTEKSFITAVSRTENEISISKEEYELYLKNKSEDSETIEKTRYVIPCKDHMVEVDIYSFTNDYGIAETELSSESEQIDMPPYIKVIKEVTGIKEYSNSYIAKKGKISL